MLSLVRAEKLPPPQRRKTMNVLVKKRPDIKDDATTEQDPGKPESKPSQTDAGQPALPIDADAEKGNDSSSSDGQELDARTIANRKNAKKSTGAKTDAGRQASARNALKHGL